MMNKPIRILGIAGSLRRESYNRAALRTAIHIHVASPVRETRTRSKTRPPKSRS